ncbi:hypothetical protein MMC17_010170 [Xylographa soralifera]|nr:hypothetical protein [Xylographa soralifera]
MAHDQDESYELLGRSSGDSEDRNRSAGVMAASATLSERIFGIFRKTRHLQSFFSRRRSYRISTRKELLWRLTSFRFVWRLVAFTIGFLFILSVVRAIIFPSYQNPPAHYQVLQKAVVASKLPGRGNPHNEKIFIAANILQEDLIRGPWGKSMLELIDLLGGENVFLSIYENDSGPGTVKALKELRRNLICNSSIVTGGHLSLDSFPTVTLPSGEKRVKRIAYLAEVRNRALRPLDPRYDPANKPLVEDGFQYTSVTYQRVLFINDVYFSPLSALHLLFSTNLDPSTNRPNYRAACAVDFIGYAMFYDTFVVRDLEGFGMGLMFYPWFTPSGKSESRGDVLAGKDAVRVKSCWGGMIALEAAPFQQLPKSSVDLSQPATDLLRFRYEPELFWESSECCLIHADMLARTPPVGESQSTGIYINPFVRVAYKPATYSWIPFITRYERFFAILQYIISRLFYPENNPRREDRAGEQVIRKMWDYDLDNDGAPVIGAGGFREVKALATPGGYCGQQRLFVMLEVKNGTNKDGKKNWEKVPVP